jgi:hypothetical protein
MVQTLVQVVVSGLVVNDGAFERLLEFEGERLQVIGQGDFA